MFGIHVLTRTTSKRLSCTGLSTYLVLLFPSPYIDASTWLVAKSNKARGPILKSMCRTRSTYRRLPIQQIRRMIIFSPQSTIYDGPTGAVLFSICKKGWSGCGNCGGECWSMSRREKKFSDILFHVSPVFWLKMAGRISFPIPQSVPLLLLAVSIVNLRQRPDSSSRS